MVKFKIKNVKLALLALFFFCFFVSLGCWQLSRASQKKLLLLSFDKRMNQPPLLAKNLQELKDWRFYQVKLVGQFDNQHAFFLDNTIFHSQVGYELYVPFKAEGLDRPILVDRGFLPLTTSRDQLPAIQTFSENREVHGLLNTPPTYVAFGGMVEKKSSSWPLRIEFVNLKEIEKLVGHPFFPYILKLASTDPAAYPIEWQIVIMPPQKHIGYAIQWFALALTLLILFVALNRQS